MTIKNLLTSAALATAIVTVAAVAATADDAMPQSVEELWADFDPRRDRSKRR